MRLPVALLAAWLAIPPPVFALPADVERLAERGAEQLYNLEFSAALATFEEVRVAHPGYPAGPGLLAAATWWQARYRFEPPTDATTRRVERWLDEAERGSRKMIRSATPYDACEGRFFLGGALGVRAHWQLLRHNWVEAAIGAREAVKVLNQLSGCTPYGDEADFGLGLYQYAAASLPAPLRWLSRYVVGGTATKDQALARLERAAVRAHWTRHDAQATLVTLYDIFDGRPDRALAPAERLLRERPHAPVAHTLQAQALLFSHRWTETLAVADRAIAWAGRSGSTFALEMSAYQYFRGMALLGLKQPRDAEVAFTIAIGAGGRPPWITAATVKRGAARDLLGDRAGALADYRHAQRLADPWHQARRAKPYLKRPFAWPDFERELTPHVAD